MNMIANKSIVLIGGAGFIGHNLALTLKKAGAKVTIIDSLHVNSLLSFASSNYDEENRDLYYRIINQRLDLLREAEIPINVQDARDYNVLCRLLTEINPEVIIHLAAVAHANKSNKDPYSTFDHSSRTLENVLDNARSKQLNIKRFIYFSSSMVYGNFKGEVVTEETVCEPLGIYGALKFGGEKLVIAYNQVFDVPYTIVRPSALYGQRCVSRRVGQIFIENALKGVPLKISGDGSNRLDFTYIEDLSTGITKILENESSENQVFNITYGESRSIKDMIEIIEEHIPGIEVQYLPKDKLMPERGTLCVDKAKELIGYTPQYPLEKGFVKYINWYKETFK
ncbi:MAG: nucleoside-diphosphate sugar epimerase [Acidobacteria bacterium]|nr:nucleoside-diphosphate sugar epimerase [Acidobacteriota bacterium]